MSPALTPPVVDDMELWEVAVTLGKALPPQDVEPASPAVTHRPVVDAETAAKRYESIRRRRLGLPDLDDEEDRPAPVDPALATLITTNAPERLR